MNGGSTCTAHWNTGHIGTHTRQHTPHGHIVCHNKEGRREGLATCDEEATREGLATCGWVLSLMILSPVRQWAYQPPLLTHTFGGKKYNQFGNNK
jgi:hypothetical protein